MIALPLFWDQYDNAQRVAETGYGIRLPTYEFEEDELLDAIDRLLADDGLRTRMAAIAERLRSTPGTVTAANLIERLAREGKPVTRA
jgi:UDP:flavonoid glycosyltransferase YjiC (YdhE family)